MSQSNSFLSLSTSRLLVSLYQAEAFSQESFSSSFQSISRIDASFLIYLYYQEKLLQHEFSHLGILMLDCGLLCQCQKLFPNPL